MAAFVTQFGEAFCGTGPETAHLNTVLGHKGGPVETSWTTALATPRRGHVAFVVAAQPGLAVKPLTLFVNKATIESDAHAALTWGAAQAGVASGVLDAVADGTIRGDVADELLCIAAVWLAPVARDAEAVYRFNREATTTSLRNGASGLPRPADVMGIRDEPYNAYWTPPDASR